MTPTKKLNPAERFFFDNAGWSFHPKRETEAEGRTRGAVALAAAEKAYFDAEAYAGVVFRVGVDFDGISEGTGPLWSMWIDNGDGRSIASLHGIDDDGDTYRRIVRAELAAECLDDLRELTAAELAAD